MSIPVHRLLRANHRDIIGVCIPNHRKGGGVRTCLRLEPLASENECRQSQVIVDSLAVGIINSSSSSSMITNDASPLLWVHFFVKCAAIVRECEEKKMSAVECSFLCFFQLREENFVYVAFTLVTVHQSV